ncbi:MAG: ATP-binding protein [Parvicellaceae bacterium]|tara:strand:+ start:2630 stop:3046 length:417 start_codon:yes stop_codon:yes gene_type:complete
MISTVDPVINQLSLASESKSLLILEDWINSLCEAYDIGEELYGNILIAVTEAVNNAIIHGNKNDVIKKTLVSYQSSEKNLVFIVKDCGVGFDFNNVKDPTDPNNIEQPDGRGIFLMRHLADEVEYSEPGNYVEIKFDI